MTSDTRRGVSLLLPLRRIFACSRRRKLLAAAAGTALLLCASLVWQFVLNAASCEAPPLPEPSEVPPIARHVRSRVLRQKQVDVVYVTAFPRHVVSSLRSLCYFAEASTFDTVHLIVPDDMAPFFSDSAAGLFQCSNVTAWSAAPSLKFRVWAESMLVPQFGPGAAWSGTTRQMTLKLAAARIVRTPFYLVMDSDVYARRPFSIGDLFDAATGTRSRVNLDQLDYCQPQMWYDHAAFVLRSSVVADTDSYCAAAAYARGFHTPSRECPALASAGPAWFAATDSARVPEDPFKLISLADGTAVIGACRHGRSHSIHVTPMLLSAEIVQQVLIPRLNALNSLSHGPDSWVDALLQHHADTARLCRGGAVSGRFYTWTEYALYFVAAVASDAMSAYHVFHEGGITSTKHSIMSPQAYDATDWRGVFTDRSDTTPFFIVHSWFGKPVEETVGHLEPHIPTLTGSVDKADMLAAPSAAPLYE